MGEGDCGKLGTGKIKIYKKPIKLDYFTEIKIKQIAAAKEFSFAVSLNEGIPYGWGRNDRNQIGQGGGLAMDVFSCDPTPCEVNLQNVNDIALSQGDVLVVTNDGMIYNWGDRVYLEPTDIWQERFQDETPNGKIIHCGVSQSNMAFVTGFHSLSLLFFFSLCLSVFCYIFATHLHYCKIVGQ